MDRKGMLHLWKPYGQHLSFVLWVQLLLFIAATNAQTSTVINTTNSSATLATQATAIPVTATSISTLIVTEISTSSSSPPTPRTNTTESATISNATTVTQAVGTSSVAGATRIPVDNVTTTTEILPDLVDNTTTELPDIVENATTVIRTSISGNESSPTSTLPASATNLANLETESSFLTTMEPTDIDTNTIGTMLPTTSEDNVVTYEILPDGVTTVHSDMTTTEEGLLTESFVRLLIIAGATAGSCLVLLVLIFIIVACCHRRHRKKKNARYYEFKKKDFKSKYERVEQQNSLARRDIPENVPIGGAWVFNMSGYQGDYEDESTPSVALRSISPLAVGAPLLKISPATTMMTMDEQNGVPDSGHGGSIPPDDSAFGFSPSLEEDIEMELNPLYRALGTSVGSGSDGRGDHSYTAGDSDNVSEGNEPAVDNSPIRDVHFNSFGAQDRVASEEVEL